MNIPIEVKKRIQEEEQMHAAVERYRAEVRAKMREHSAPVKKSRRLWMLGIGIVLIVGVIGAEASSNAVTIGNSNSTVSIPGTAMIGTTSASSNLSGSRLTIVGNQPIEVHSDYANGIQLYTHANASFRAPYIDFYKSGGSEDWPTPVEFGGYEEGSFGGINFGGWDGSKYFSGSAAIYTQADEDWTPTTHGGHLSIYGTNIGGSSTQQIAQFGGLDPSSTGTTDNIISYRPLTWGGNQSGNPGLFPTSNPPVVAIRNGNNTSAAALTALTVQLVTGTFSSLANCVSGTEGTQAAVTDANTSTWGATISGGGTNHVLAYCDGTTWTVMAK
jgi:hypothetical protein